MVDITCSYNTNCSTINMVLKKKDELMELGKSAVLMTSTIKSKKQGRVMEEVQKLLCVNAGSASVLSPTQLNAASKES